MKQIYLLIAASIIFTFSLSAQEFCSGRTCMPEKIQSKCTVNQSNGCIDWANGVIYAAGMGVPNPNFKTQAQRTYSAYEASKTVAMRNLLQMVEGINISSSRTVKAGMLESDTINTQISGKIRHVEEVGRPKTMNDGSVWVTMRMYLRDIVSILMNNQQFAIQANEQMIQQTPQKQTAPAEPEENEEGIQYGGEADTVYGGLIIDARGTGLVPAMSPKIYNTEGKEIYGSAAIERDFVLRYGIAGYVKDIEKSATNKRIKGKPLYVKGGLSEGKSSDLILSDKDSELIQQLDASQSFLREARVLIVID